jgi:hypothetical protein
MSQSFYRIQTADRDVADLLTTEGQVSHYWGQFDEVVEGVSVCESLEDLAQYLAGAGSGIPFGDGEWVIVELEGDRLATVATDAAYGEALIRPTAIVSVAPMGDEFFDMIGAAIDAANA